MNTKQITSFFILVALISQEIKALDFRRAARNKCLGETRCISIGHSQNWAEVNSATRVEIVDGDEAPHVEGLPYLKTFFNNGRGFTKIVFTPSTMRVVVGKNWNPA